MPAQPGMSRLISKFSAADRVRSGGVSQSRCVCGSVRRVERVDCQVIVFRSIVLYV